MTVTKKSGISTIKKSLLKQDMAIIGEDRNARIDHNTAAMMPTISKYGIGDWCASGERFLSFAKEHELFVNTTMFSTSKISNHVELQPDHMPVNRR